VVAQNVINIIDFGPTIDIGSLSIRSHSLFGRFSQVRLISAEDEIAAELPSQSVDVGSSGLTTLRHQIEAVVSRCIESAGEVLDGDAPLQAYGLTSVAMIQLVSEFQKLTPTHLPKTFLFQFPTVNAIVREIEARNSGVHRKAGVSLATPSLAPQLPPSTSSSEKEVAIIGAACRFPGDVANVNDFWELLMKRTVAITKSPRHRFGITTSTVAGSGRGGFLNNAEHFDGEFFRISPTEASVLDPQQALILEETWHALEDAGIPGFSLRGKQIGIFVGAWAEDTTSILRSRTDEESSVFRVSGGSTAMASGRVAFFLGCQGLALTVNTACSSSLVATHLACRSVRAQESEMAICCGVNVMLHPGTTDGIGSAGMLSPEGRCKTFDAAADGYVRSEGVAVLVLKPLDRAVADGDNVLAVLRGSAVNQDGNRSALTAPNGIAQQAVIRQALADAAATPDDVDFLETHGTGTRLGDPIEIEAIGAVFGNNTTKPTIPLLLGAAKANMGHMESVSGLVGLLKVVASLVNGRIPGHPSLERPNPLIDFHAIPAAVARAAVIWRSDVKTTTKRRRTAGVSSFGFSGTNSHAIVSEAPSTRSTAVLPITKVHTLILPISAASRASFAELLAAFSHCLGRWETDDTTTSFLRAEVLCNTAAKKREHLAGFRTAVVGRTVRQLVDALAMEQQQQQQQGGPVRQAAAPPQRPRVCFLFTGQGSQYARMGR
jgi:acyl transferase domain-containing protein/acyl carrier protein